uniref:Uncharacterized protein n=1 Tax=Entomoneis paludosa TaxID=265537 RepID=A0A7S2Y590_9STRA|eukprot:CAMPEP_0172456762 /NCGR_PEP_ID=MMETSP1065-20121228/17468_1 /TAXON_ID=265537 /ORGANISM="Amphiprora paludosa, Strain CCMP125" /LENGTH=161 /DNA_ID=CAMNT_0013209987 /DNA_START=17 /DNA_END=502 /DNA_ORIENTATION=+
MAQHKSDQPATQAIELSKKRRRSCEQEVSNSLSRCGAKNVSLDMSDVFQQAALVETNSLSFPTIEWSSDDEESSVSSSLEAQDSEDLDFLVGKKGMSKMALMGPPVALLDMKQDLKLLEIKQEMSSLSRKKRKISSPHMVRSIALTSDLSDLATCWNMCAH